MRNISTSNGSGFYYMQKKLHNHFRFMNKSDKFKSMPVDQFRMFKADKAEKSINVSDHFQKLMLKHHQIYFQKIKLSNG